MLTRERCSPSFLEKWKTQTYVTNNLAALRAAILCASFATRQFVRALNVRSLRLGETTGLNSLAKPSATNLLSKVRTWPSFSIVYVLFACEMLKTLYTALYLSRERGQRINKHIARYHDSIRTFYNHCSRQLKDMIKESVNILFFSFSCSSNVCTKRQNYYYTRRECFNGTVNLFSEPTTGTMHSTLSHSIQFPLLLW